MKTRYYYLANYGGPYLNLNISPAGNTKMEYIISCFKKMGRYLRVVSTAETKNKGICLPKAIRNDDFQIKFFLSFLSGNYFLNRLAKMLNRMQVYIFLLTRKKDDVVLVYHNMPYLRLINKIQLHRSFKMIYEVEEIYSYVSNKSKEEAEFEIESLKKADGYIFVTKGLNDIVNKSNKPYVVASGSYKTNDILAHKYNDGFVHCVYAGTLDPRKGGATATVAAAEFLPGNYKVHILGFGTDEQISYLNEMIKEVSAKTKCVVSYDGCLAGEEYLSFLQQCHIGLSTQKPDAEFNATSFPSKIMVYLSNGLNVVSIYTDVIASFSGSEFIDFYYEDVPKEIAKAIIRSSETIKDGREIVNNLDKIFVKELTIFLEKI